MSIKTTGRRATRAQLAHRRLVHAPAIAVAGPGPYRWPQVDRIESTGAYLERVAAVREVLPNWRGK